MSVTIARHHRELKIQVTGCLRDAETGAFDAALRQRASADRVVIDLREATAIGLLGVAAVVGAVAVARDRGIDVELIPGPAHVQAACAQVAIPIRLPWRGGESAPAGD